MTINGVDNGALVNEHVVHLDSGQRRRFLIAREVMEPNGAEGAADFPLLCRSGNSRTVCHLLGWRRLGFLTPCLGRSMRSIGICIVAAAALVGTRAFAADMPLKAPPPPVPVYDWTGFYVGGNFGYGWGDPRTTAAGSGTTVIQPAFPASFAFTDSNTAPVRGALGGIQVGYNYQFNPKWLLGLEADFQGSGQRGSNALVDPFSTLVCDLVIVGGGCGGSGTINGTAITSYQAGIAWFDTVRLRLGYLINDQVMLYGTGGLAYGRVQLSGTTTTSGTAVFFGTPDVLAPTAGGFSTSRTNTGFTVGGGMEARLSPVLPANWTWKLEYLYLDLGSLNATTAFGGNFVFFSLPLSGTIALHTHFTDNIVRIGINYRFGN